MSHMDRLPLDVLNHVQALGGGACCLHMVVPGVRAPSQMQLALERNRFLETTILLKVLCFQHFQQLHARADPAVAPPRPV